jgi:hypothetical protein
MGDITHSMTNANKVTVQASKAGQYFITIPRAIADFKGWHKGTKLEISEDRYGEVTLKEVRE